MSPDGVFSSPYEFGYFHGYCKRASETQDPPRRYPISLQLRYKATSEQGTLHGFGQTRMMSSKDIFFAASDGLEPGMEAEIAVAWPFLLDGRIRLQLILKATIISCRDGVALARILVYHFRTCRREEVGQSSASHQHSHLQLG
jgi:hypothetical protein